ncbi:MAG: hypothetical protein Q9221_001102 [Calogaya cf. arnoldii]
MYDLSLPREAPGAAMVRGMRCAGEKSIHRHAPKFSIYNMAEPLSLAAGVIGVLTAAAQISTLVVQFAVSSKGAPKSARTVLIEVNGISSILSHLRLFLSGDETFDQSRTQLLHVDQVLAIITGCVTTFSELEQLLDRLSVTEKANRMAALDRAKWARKEKTVSNLIQRLQNHKASLSLILNVLNG